jgi:spermidine synthase
VFAQMVVEVCKKYIPSMAQGFNDRRVELIIGDGFAFIEQHANEFDVIITDSSDPEGKANISPL